MHPTGQIVRGGEAVGCSINRRERLDSFEIGDLRRAKPPIPRKQACGSTLLRLTARNAVRSACNVSTQRVTMWPETGSSAVTLPLETTDSRPRIVSASKSS